MLALRFSLGTAGEEASSRPRRWHNRRQSTRDEDDDEDEEDGSEDDDFPPLIRAPLPCAVVLEYIVDLVIATDFTLAHCQHNGTHNTVTIITMSVSTVRCNSNC